MNRTLGSGRFELLSRLGSGSFGEVYRCRDRTTDAIVALKLLHKSDPSSLLRFKAEFRAVAGLVHPNLVRLHELHRDGELWFFTMELVPGASLDAYVRPDGQLQSSRMISAYGQVATALAALHQNGQVHRDVKPTNVRVDPNGRAVLLDFGLAAAVHSGSRMGTSGQSSGAFIGSPYYMSPEQAMGEPPQPASDWYSFGVCLYESLAGRRPFEGRPLEVLVGKRHHDAPSPPANSHGLAELVERLLARDPELRPTTAEVLTFFKQTSREREVRSRPTFVGREFELAELTAAARGSHAGVAATVWLEASPGVGKTALLEHFWATLPPETLVIYGRCYEQESVPYKGIDAAVDHLTRRLCDIPKRELHDFAAARVAALVAVFPVLARVPSFASVDHDVGFEPAQLRMEAFAALRARGHCLDKQRFAPHLTLVRPVRDKPDAAALAAHAATLAGTEWNWDGFRLVRSRMSELGSSYETIGEWTLPAPR